MMSQQAQDPSVSQLLNVYCLQGFAAYGQSDTVMSFVYICLLLSFLSLSFPPAMSIVCHYKSLSVAFLDILVSLCLDNINIKQVSLCYFHLYTYLNLTPLSHHYCLCPCPVHGSWSPWSVWSDCDGCAGSSSRFRQCNSPPARFGGLPCLGESRQTRGCHDNVTVCSGQLNIRLYTNH